HPMGPSVTTIASRDLRIRPSFSRPLHPASLGARQAAPAVTMDNPTSDRCRPVRVAPMRLRNGSSATGRILLALLTLYAIVLIAPDLLRIVHPLGSFGLAANADGLIFDVRGPFASEAESPAWRAGVRTGDRLDLAAMRCLPLDTELCATAMALW